MKHFISRLRFIANAHYMHVCGSLREEDGSHQVYKPIELWIFTAKESCQIGQGLDQQ